MLDKNENGKMRLLKSQKFHKNEKSDSFIFLVCGIKSCQFAILLPFLTLLFHN